MSTVRASQGKILKRANPATIQDKFMVGYQGWFTCPGDGELIDPGHHGWLHWFNHPITAGGRPNTDLWPDVSSYSPSELFPAPGLKSKSGEQAFLFSSRHPKTVQRHFNWMAEHGVDGAFLQRFVGQCDLEGGNEGIRRLRDEIGDRVREAAEKEGRVFAIMYDVSGVAPDRIQKIIERDWIHLIHEQGILDSPNYLRERGKPVISLWGFGFDNSGHSPSLVRAITSYIRSVTPGGAYIMAGTPAHWRTAVNDADRNPEFLDVWLNEFDAISPWTVGRYRNEDDADKFAETNIKGDVELLRKRNEEGRWRKVDYIPVVLPGGSGFNLSEGKWGFNDIKRHGGRFLWQQIFNVRRQGVRIIYGAMWDEYDEGTAFMPVVEKKRTLPESDKYPFMALDEDGFDLPSDWYMRICGFAAEGLRGERRIHESFPSKELQDYWSTRPRYDDVDSKASDFVSGSSAGGGSGGDDGQSYQDWLAAQKEDKEEPPPPPYSLEAAESAVGVQSQPAIAAGSAEPATSSPQVSPTPAPAPAPTPTQAPQPSLATSPASPFPQQMDTSPRPSYSTGPNHSPVMGPPATTFQPSISTLANDFGRQHISSPDPRPMQPVSPPPLHLAASNFHPHSQSPPQVYSHLQSRPHSQSPPQSHAGPPSGSAPMPGEPQSPGPWSQAQWPPPEWQVNRPQQPQQYPNHQPQKQQQIPYSGYQGQGPPAPAPGAGLIRPHSFSASHHSSSPSSLRPHASVGPSSVRPSTTVPQQPSSNHSGTFPQPTMGNPGGPYAATSSYTPTSGASSYTPGGGPSFPSATSASSYTPDGPSYPSPHGASSYSPGGTSYPPQGSSYPGQSYPAVPPHASPPQSPPPNTTYGMPQSQMHPMHPGHTPPQFPQAQGGEGYFNIPQQHPHPQQQSSYQPSPYPGQHVAPYNAPYPQPYMPASNAGIAFPGGQNNPPVPPAFSPHPTAYSPYSQSGPSGPSFPTASTSSSGAFGFALSAVDKVAGKKTRQQFETQVDSLAQTGSKLFSKFTK